MTSTPLDPIDALRAVTERNDIAVTEDDLQVVLNGANATSAAIARLVADLTPETEPASVFSSPAGITPS